MTKCVEMLAAVLIACVSGSAAATICEIQPIGEEGGETCGEPGGGGGTGGAPTVYTLQGVIQHQGYENDSGGGRHAKIRAYSRFANPNNDRVDADYINVRCYAYGPTGTTTDYDSENGGALVDVHFYSSAYPAIGGSGFVNVQCTHHAEFNGVSYDTTSSQQINIQNYP